LGSVEIRFENQKYEIAFHFYIFLAKRDEGKLTWVINVRYEFRIKRDVRHRQPQTRYKMAGQSFINLIPSLR
jgi:hypothetical protein